MSDAEPHVVILGGGFAGIAAAQGLKNAPVRITLVDSRNHHLFQPMLYQVATASVGTTEIAFPIRSILRPQANASVLLAEATGFDLDRRAVRLADGRSLGYDYLVIAIGVRPGYFGHPAWEAVAPGLKTLEDAVEIRRRVLLAFERAEQTDDAAAREAWLTFVVVGAGPTGVELAGALAELRDTVAKDFRRIDARAARVVLLDAGPRILPSYPERLIRATQTALERMGVEIRTGTRVESLLRGRVETGDGALATETVIWAAGVEASGLLATLGAPLDSAGRVEVEPDCSIPAHPEVFVVGDAAAYRHPTLGVLPCVCPVAIQQGRYAAKLIAGEVTQAGSPRQSFANSAEGQHAVSEAGDAPGTHERPQFHYWNKGQLAVIGRGRAVLAVGPLRLGGVLAWLIWAVIHLYYLMGFRNRTVVLLEWGFFHFISRHGARIIASPSAPASAALPAPGSPPRIPESTTHSSLAARASS